MSNRSLPPEILGLIIENIAPSDACIAFPASHVVTRTLHACLTVSKTISWVAQRQIQSRCLYINSPWRLDGLLRALKGDTTHREPFAIPLSLKMKSSTSMYLSPFLGDTIDDAGVVANIKTLFAFLSNSLQRLVINMPLRNMSPEDPSAPKIQPALRDAFAQLRNLDQFVSVQDELYLDSSSLSNHPAEPQVWASWPRLKHLGLYNVDIRSQSVREGLRALPGLETLVLTRPHGLVDEELTLTMSCLNASAKVIIINTPEGHRNGVFGQKAPSMIDSQGKARCEPSHHVHDFGRLHRLDVPKERSTRWTWGFRQRKRFDDVTTCQHWMERKALDGTLWEYGDGEPRRACK
ncbi:hypothetical protein BDY17DRAFT_160702 [Neohortaea acidophila]|uniref:F-box domain-containing protein n=1 Tax=Neohortaea acidophila TaxID=245834 RepID=A0A6A6PQT8_9PEZI|nr:uncharacterized protein BDY17DRAFT_160702 [Neohortaea acidophila]KAF2482478.1 hypothetical protein BDY17DRAFT_160702 [Neohortaea acidophila]